MTFEIEVQSLREAAKRDRKYIAELEDKLRLTERALSAFQRKPTGFDERFLDSVAGRTQLPSSEL
jgi:hypothetical protein